MVAGAAVAVARHCCLAECRRIAGAALGEAFALCAASPGLSGQSWPCRAACSARPSRVGWHPRWPTRSSRARSSRWAQRASARRRCARRSAAVFFRRPSAGAADMARHWRGPCKAPCPDPQANTRQGRKGYVAIPYFLIYIAHRGPVRAHERCMASQRKRQTCSRVGDVWVGGVTGIRPDRHVSRATAATGTLMHGRISRRVRLNATWGHKRPSSSAARWRGWIANPLWEKRRPRLAPTRMLRVGVGGGGAAGSASL